MENDFTANDHPTKVVEVDDTGFYANDHPYKVVNVGGSSGIKAKVVDELPETGEDGVIYLILKEETKEGDIYDEWIWVEESGGEYAWEHLGATNEVTIQLYDTTGTNTDGAMTQKAATNMIYPEGYETTKDYIKIPLGSATHGGRIAIGSDRIPGSNSINIGKNAGVDKNSGTISIGGSANSGNTSIWGTAVGYGSASGASYSVALGTEASVPNQTNRDYGVALGARSNTGRAYEVSVGKKYGTSSDFTRYVANVTDPELPQDAATKNYVDTHGVSALSDTDFNNLWSNA